MELFWNLFGPLLFAGLIGTENQIYTILFWVNLQEEIFSIKVLGENLEKEL